MPSSFYFDPATYQRSLEHIFARSWQFIGDSDCVKVPGAVHPLTMLDGSLNEPLVLTRDMKDAVHLLSNVCTHRGNIVCEAGGNERFLRCRYHGRRFGLDGKFQFMPEFEGVENFPSSDDNLASVPFGSWDKLLFAGVKPPASLETWLGPMMERLSWLPLHEFIPSPTRARDYLVKAHWALYIENYLEGFHIPFIHAGLNEVLDYGNYDNELYQYLNLQFAVGKSGDDAFDLPRSSPDYGTNVSAYYFWVFPNLMFNFYPWGLSINVIKPLGPELTRVSFLPYVWDPAKLGRGAGAELDRVEREDEVIVELVQKGMRSRFYNKGRYSVAREKGVHHFHSLLCQFLAEGERSLVAN